MGFKSKVVGVLAAAALTLGIGAGIVSAQTSNGSAVLDAGECKLTLINGNLFYGTYVWNGTSYVLDPNSSGTGSATVTLDVDTPKGKPCVIDTSSTGLHLGGDTSLTNASVNHIPASGFLWSVQGGPNGTAVATNLNAPQGDWDLTLTMPAPVNTLTAGPYSGTLVFDISDN